MLIFLTSLFATLNNAVLDLPFPCCPGLENLALRHHSGVLRRSAGKRPKLTSGDRLLWICLSRLWRDWLSAMAIVKPETVVAWLRRFWRWKVRRGQPGRPRSEERRVGKECSHRRTACRPQRKSARITKRQPLAQGASHPRE